MVFWSDKVRRRNWEKKNPPPKVDVSKVEFGFYLFIYITILFFLFEKMVRGEILLQEVRSQTLGALQ